MTRVPGGAPDAPPLGGPGAQPGLFDEDPAASPWPEGLRYRPDFLDSAEEAALLEAIRALPLQPARYREHTARRRIVSYGSAYDFTELALRAAEAPPPELRPLCEKAAAWIDAAAQDFRNVLVAEYAPGTPLGWHRDVPEFETVVGVSLGGWARMRLRRWPPRPRSTVLALDLAPRSAYVLQGEARWAWQHCIAPTEALRYSVTLRTARAGSALRR